MSKRLRTWHRAVLSTATVAVLVAFAFADADAALARFEFVDDSRVAQVEAMTEKGIAYFRLRDVALAVSGIRYRNPSTGKVTLSVADHQMSVTPDSRFAVLDRTVENIMEPVLIRRGDVWVPTGFLTRLLAHSLDSQIRWLPAERTVRVERLRPSVDSLQLRQTTDGTIVELGLTSPAEFSAVSRSRASVEVMLSGARLPDSLAVEQNTEYVSGVLLEESPDGVRAEITLTDRAGSYSARLLGNPPRIEVLVRGSIESATPSLELRGVKHLLPESDSLFATPGLGLETVMIDPAHGGSDRGAVGRRGLEEKVVTLALARELSYALQRKGFYVFMTRSSDSLVPEHRRAEIANLADADIFVGLQCGAWYSGWARGFGVDYYEPPGWQPEDESVRRGRGLPRVETRAPSGAVDELIWEKLQEGHVAESRALARAVDASMKASLSLNDRGVGRRSSRVLGGCAMPAVQVELGYITNRDEEALLSDESFLREAAQAIADGIAAYRSGAKERGQ